VGSVPPTFGSIIWPAASQATGTSWASSSTGAFPKNWKSLTSVACLSPSLCYTAGSDLSGSGGTVLATTNFGKTWNAVASGNMTPWAMSCPTDKSCTFGGGQSVVTTINGGQSWTRTVISKYPSADAGFVISIACGSQDHCMASEIGNVSLTGVIVASS
jgi:photosystem II stability/assembly factor-like uncharacterized protein